jgi:hypothetical protein
MRRLFTFGCSFTEYRWPTWADIIGQSFEHYENWGLCGSGNYLISSRVMECNHVNKLTKDDVVIVMFTSIPRIDFYNKNWSMKGNIFTTMNLPFEEEWITNHWSIVQGFYNTWIAVKQTKLLLDNIGCEYKLLRAFDISPNTAHNINYFSPNVHEQKFLEEYSKDINLYFGNDPIMLDWTDQQETGCYIFDKGQHGQKNYRDYHPTIRHHEKWCREVLSEYYKFPVDIDLLEDNFPLDDFQKLFSHKFRGIKKSVTTCLLY